MLLLSYITRITMLLKPQRDFGGSVTVRGSVGDDRGVSDRYSFIIMISLN